MTKKVCSGVGMNPYMKAGLLPRGCSSMSLKSRPLSGAWARSKAARGRTARGGRRVRIRKESIIHLVEIEKHKKRWFIETVGLSIF